MFWAIISLVLVVVGVAGVLWIGYKFYRNFKTRRAVALWARENNLNYARIKISKGLQLVVLRCLIWGKYKEENICVFFILSSATLDVEDMEYFTFVNGKVYEGMLSLEDIKKILGGRSVPKKEAGHLLDHGDIVITHYMIAQVFFKYARNIDYPVAYKVYKPIGKFLDINKKISAKNIEVYEKDLRRFVIENIKGSVNRKDIDDLIDAFVKIVKNLKY